MLKDNIGEATYKLHRPDGHTEELTMKSVAAAASGEAGPSMPATPSPAKYNLALVKSNPSYDESSPMAYSSTARSSSSGEN